MIHFCTIMMFSSILKYIYYYATLQVSDITILGSSIVDSDPAPGSSWIANRDSLPNDIIDCKFLSHAYTFCPGLHCPYWHLLKDNTTPCALPTYTYPFSRPLTQKGGPCLYAACRGLPHPDGILAVY